MGVLEVNGSCIVFIVEMFFSTQMILCIIIVPVLQIYKSMVEFFSLQKPQYGANMETLFYCVKLRVE